MKNVSRIIAMLLAVCMLLGVPVSFAHGAGEVVYITGDHKYISIYATEYSLDGVSYPHSGKFVISGNVAAETSTAIGFWESGTYDITLHNVHISSTAGYNCLQTYNNITVNLRIEGVNTMTGANHAIVNDFTEDKIVFDVAENSSLTVSSGEGYDVITSPDDLSMKDGSALPGSDVWGWNTSNSFVLSKGTPKDCSAGHAPVEGECKILCVDHNVTFESAHDNGYASVEGGHVIKCKNCQTEVGEVESHNTRYVYEDDNTCRLVCSTCGYEGEALPHVMDQYDWFNDKYCINYCSRCYGANPDIHALPHKLTVQNIPATELEAAKTVKSCSRCLENVEEYDKENSILFVMNNENGTDWNEDFVLPYVNGVPTTLVRNYNGNEDEIYALPYDEENSYTFYWSGAGSSIDNGLEIWLPGEDEPVFEQNDLSEYEKFEEILSINVADYTAVDEAMAQIPEDLTYYTKASTDKLIKAVANVKRMLPTGQQKAVDKMAADIEAAVDALVESDAPESAGIINLKGDDYLYVEGDYVEYYWDRYEYGGDLTLFQSVPGFINASIELYGTKRNVTLINTFIRSDWSTISIEDESDITLKAVGANASIAVYNNEEDYGQPGIEVDSSSKLTIHKDSGSLVAMSTDYYAGIGGEDGCRGGSVTVNGGVIFALSTGDAAGIGGGYDAGFEKITINGGRVHGECLEEDGAGIGCGDDGNGGDIVINGGHVTALSLDDDGAGMGGADNGHCDSITINGGTIIAGSDDAAAIGGGQDADSYAGKIIINGGIITAHPDHGDSESLIGNGHSDSEGESEYNFVQINGGTIFDDNCQEISPAPKNKAGKLLTKVSLPVHKNYDEVVLELSDGSAFRVPVQDGAVQSYLPLGEDVTLLNEKALKEDPVVKILDSSKVFKDVKKGTWYKNAIDYAYSHGFVNGVKKNEFGLESEVTRGMFITILARMSGIDTSTAANKAAGTHFTDVKKGQYYTAAIAWGARAGIVKGTSKTTFAPDAPIQRQQLCVMVANYATHNGITLKAKEKAITFADAGSIASYAKTAVKTCQRADILNGYIEGGKTLMKPENTATRAEAAKILAEFHKNFVA